jgi:hypothetical protein
VVGYSDRLFDALQDLAEAGGGNRAFAARSFPES